MSGGEITVIIVVAIIATTAIFGFLYRYLTTVYGRHGGAQAELEGLRQQVRQLSDRMQLFERMEPRVRVLEQIVTDSGAQTATQIEALRDKDRIENGDKVQ